MSATNGTRTLTRQQERAAQRARDRVWKQAKALLHATVERICQEKRLELEFAITMGYPLEADVVVHVPDEPKSPIIRPEDA